MLAVISIILFQISLVERTRNWELKLLWGLDQSHFGTTLVSLFYVGLWPCFNLLPLKYKPTVCVPIPSHLQSHL